jgi:hypothetical protein
MADVDRGDQVSDVGRVERAAEQAHPPAAGRRHQAIVSDRHGGRRSRHWHGGAVYV